MIFTLCGGIGFLCVKILSYVSLFEKMTRFCVCRSTSLFSVFIEDPKLGEISIIGLIGGDLRMTLTVGPLIVLAF